MATSDFIDDGTSKTNIEKIKLRELNYIEGLHNN